MKRLIGILLLSSALVACGGDDDGGGGSGVDSDKQLSDITAEESADLCGYLDAQVDQGDYERFFCRVEGIIAVAQDPSADCEAVYDDCLANPDAIDPAVDCSDTDPEQFSGCTDVTVGDLEACLDATAAQLSSLADSTTCDTAPTEIQTETPAACEPIETGCPLDSARIIATGLAQRLAEQAQR